VSVISADTGAVTATISVSHVPFEMGLDPATGTVYLTNNDDNTVSVISEATGTVTATVGVGGDPTGVAADPHTGTVYVTNYSDNTVSVISPVTTVTVDVTGGQGYGSSSPVFTQTNDAPPG